MEEDRQVDRQQASRQTQRARLYYSKNFQAERKLSTDQVNVFYTEPLPNNGSKLHSAWFHIRAEHGLHSIARHLM